MLKDILEKQLNKNNPTQYIYQLTVCKNEIQGLIDEFEKEYTWCAGCHTYIKNEDAKKLTEPRKMLRCCRCDSILKFLNDGDAK